MIIENWRSGIGMVDLDKLPSYVINKNEKENMVSTFLPLF